MRELIVDLGERSYPILIGSGLLSQEDLLRRYLPAGPLLVVSNSTVAPLYLDQVLRALPGRETASLVLPDGERYKTLDALNTVVGALLDHRFGRDAALLALGGGVVGDITGFAAACYQRGVAYLQLPTTLLAQVDSAVGGKTAVNHPQGKNMIGAFHQPGAVIADVATLSTLPDRELRAGLAEVIKYGAIRDAGFFAWLEENMDALLARDAAALETAIERSCANKAAVVAADEREAGLRATLNFGHTFGHAIETALAYEHWLHGEAVAAGMVMAADLSCRLGLLDRESADRLERLLQRTGLPVRAPAGIAAGRLRALMEVDKKSLAGHLRLVLLQHLGEARVVSDFSEETLRETIAAHVAPAGTAG